MKLSDPVSTLSGVGPVYLLKLKKLGINTIEDLLLHIPTRYVDFSNKVPIASLRIGEFATIIAQVISAKNVYAKSGKIFQVVKVSDGHDSVEAVWMRQPWIIRRLTAGSVLSLSGKLSFWGKKRVLMFPEYELYSSETIHTGRLVPIYPETSGLTSKWLRKTISKVLQEIEIEDFITSPDFEFVDLKHAIKKIHKPKSKEEFENALKRLSFNELLMLQIENNLKKLWLRESAKAHLLPVREDELNSFVKSLPFELTSAQKRSIMEIISDLASETPMNRLLEGDVGSGKTVVAAAGVYAGLINAKKSVIMAPTQILAQQHFTTLKQILGPFNPRISLVTSETKEKAQTADVVVGTHALLFKTDFAHDAGFVVIDEQHRFGVVQRAKIAEFAKSTRAPHILTMTATPIPRTIALTIYGDLDLSTLDELPKGRQKISTWIVPPQKRKAAEEWIRSQVAQHQSQIFVVCPLIEESDIDSLSQVKAVKLEYQRLQKIYPEMKIAFLHGRMRAHEKNKVIKDFKCRKYDILVSTPVIEVGIDIPNATIMIIEGAERFGLAQLHQLRGRVGRGEKKSYCLLFTSSKSAKVRERLSAVVSAKTGKELAEIDLRLRGPGELLGIRQSGLTELKIARWDDLELIKKSRDFAEKVVANQTKYKKVLDYYRKKQAAPN